MSSFAQQAATVKSFTLTTDHIPGADRRNDYNGTPCALIKVQVVDEITRVEGGKIGDIVNKGVEKWVYMCKGSRNMTIHLKNFLPLQLTFRDYSINSLESNRVYQLVLVLPEDKKAAEAEKQRQMEEQRKYEEQKRKDLLKQQELERVKEQQRLEEERQKLEQRQQQLQEQQNAQEQQRRNQEQQRLDQEQQRLEQVNRQLEQAKLQQEEEARQRHLKEVRRQQQHENFLNKMEAKRKQAVVMGVDGGVNIAQAHFSGGSGTTSSVTGLHLGFTAEFRLANGFNLNTGLLYSGKGYKYVSEKNNVDEEGIAQYLDLPVLASARIPLGSAVSLDLNAGPYMALCIGGDVKDNWKGSQKYKEPFSSVYSGFDYGAQIGIGLNLAHHYHLGVSYQLGMAGSYSNRNLSLGVGYRF